MTPLHLIKLLHRISLADQSSWYYKSDLKFNSAILLKILILRCYFASVVIVYRVLWSYWTEMILLEWRWKVWTVWNVEGIADLGKSQWTAIIVINSKKVSSFIHISKASNTIETGNPSMRENLVITSEYRPPVLTDPGGRGRERESQTCSLLLSWPRINQFRRNQ